jgi:S1-C subfamily serine protease
VWSDDTGKYSVEAELVRVEGDSVVLKKSGEEVIKVPLATLCKADRDFVARKKLEAARRADARDIRADYFLGLTYALAGHDWSSAEKSFSQCAKRDRTHIGALNNLALTQVRQRRYGDAVGNWKAALKVAPASRQVLQNLGRFVALAGAKKIAPSSSCLKTASELCAKVAAGEGGERAYHANVGWLYIPYYAKWGKARLPEQTPPEQKQEKPHAPGPDRVERADTDLFVAGLATGFVIHPHYILTNRHVVEGSDGLLVAASANVRHRFPASIAAVSEEPGPDLAIIRCDSLNAPSVGFRAPGIVDRGTEVMVLGFPGLLDEVDLCPRITVTKGLISALPAQNDGSYRVDAATNPGSSGGPVCDQAGNVLGIHWGRERGETSSYGLAIPHDAALAFVSKKVPGFAGPAAGPTGAKALQDWTVEVDRAVSPATVLVLVQQRLESTGSGGVAKAPGRGGVRGPEFDAFEDPWCMVCGGSGYVKCPACKGSGQVVVGTQMRVAGTDPSTGRAFGLIAPKFANCKSCGGTGKVRCPDCVEGVDRGLRGAARLSYPRARNESDAQK